MRLLKTELTNFFENAARVQKNELYPVLSYLLLRPWADVQASLLKTDLNSFYIKELTIVKERESDLLLDERILRNFVSFSIDEYIYIEKHGQKLRISDSQSEVFFTPPPAEDFPACDTTHSKTVSTNLGIRDTLRRASNFIIKEEIPTVRSFIFVGDGNVCASNSWILFKQPFEFEGKLVLDSKTAEIVASFEETEIGYSEKFITISTPSGLFGFIKSEINYIDLAKYCVKGSHSIQLEAVELFTFCRMAVNCRKSDDVMANMLIQDFIELELNDAAFDIRCKKNINFTGKCPKMELKFNPLYMLSLLKGIENTTIHLAFTDKSMIIEDEGKTFYSMISKIV